MSRIHVPIVLRWADLDAYGHVNNATMLRLLEEARIQVFWADRHRPDAPSTALLDNGEGADTLSLIGRQEIEYLAPVPYLRRPIDVQLWVSRLGGASLEVDYEVWSPEGDPDPVLYARAATTVVLVHPETGAPRRITPAERVAWEAHMDAPLEFRRR